MAVEEAGKAILPWETALIRLQIISAPSVASSGIKKYSPISSGNTFEMAGPVVI